jgi:hypothetical protein
MDRKVFGSKAKYLQFMFVSVRMRPWLKIPIQHHDGIWGRQSSFALWSPGFMLVFDSFVSYKMVGIAVRSNVA